MGDVTLKTASILYSLGFGIHWIKPKDKRPIQSKWADGKRQSFEELKRTYKSGMNIGVRLGAASKLKDGTYLGVIDCDVKSRDSSHRLEMEKALRELINPKDVLTVLSGRGQGSRHLYVRSLKPLTPRRFKSGSEKVKVFMPSSQPSKYEKENLSLDDLRNGFRLRPAWEISIMGARQQVVLPPSIHPDSKKAYQWLKSDAVGDLDFLRSCVERVPLFKDPGESGKTSPNVPIDFKFNEQEVSLFDREMPAAIVDGITTGKGVEDRSAFLMKASLAMLRAGFSDNEILNVLTDRDNFIGDCAYEHRGNTNSRRAAADWVYKYTLSKARTSLDAARDFEHHAEVVDEKDIEAFFTDGSGDWKSTLERNQTDGKPKPTFQNIKLVLENCTDGEPFIGRNLFKVSDVWLDETPWGSKVDGTVNDTDLIKIKNYMSKNFRLEVSVEKILEVLILLAYENSFHPVEDFLNELEWDGTPRVDNWLKTYLNANGPSGYLQAVGRKTLVAMIARVLEPGIKFDNVLILEGDQGIGKSTTARILADPWFSDSHIDITDKDAVMNMQGVWVYEIGELSAMSRADVKTLKSFITRQVDKIRPPYGRLPVEYPRQSVFIGTTNDQEYLKDATGNRRFWPVLVGKLKRRELKKDRDQLLAEAKFLYDMGEPLWLEDESVENLARGQQLNRVERDILEDVVSDFMKSGAEGFDETCFRMVDLFKFLEGGTMKMDRQTQMRIGHVLTNLGYKRKRKMVNKINTWWWEK